jgi:GNAT superfamily N-acetyltransferase
MNINSGTKDEGRFGKRISSSTVSYTTEEVNKMIHRSEPQISWAVSSIPYADRQILVQFYKNQREKIKVQKSDRCFLLKDTASDLPLAAVKFTALPDGSWLLRNMLVAKEYRRQGIGHALLKQLSPQMQQMSVSHESLAGLYCFPWSELTGFYGQHGFREASDETMSPKTTTVLSQEVISRYKAYRARGLDIRCCYWSTE